jgi:hypothetical protein
MSRIFPIRPRLPLGSFGGDVKFRSCPGIQDVRPEGPRRGAEARIGADRAQNTPPDQQPALFPHPRDGRGESRWRSSPSSDAAGGRSRSSATRCTPSSTATPTTAAPRAARGDFPVYNLSLSPLRKAFPDWPPFQILEIPTPDGIGSADYRGGSLARGGSHRVASPLGPAEEERLS